MSFIDVVYKILLEGSLPSEFGGKGIAVAITAALILSVYIFFCYRVLGRRTFIRRATIFRCWHPGR